MKSIYQAYQAYENRVQQGEFSTAKAYHHAIHRQPYLASLGDLLIRTGLKLKGQDCNGTTMAWSPMIGSKP